MKQAIRVATTSPVTVSASTDCTVVTDLSVAGAVTVNLPAGANKQIFIIVDGKGDAGTNNVTINRNGSDTIAGLTSLVLNHNRQVAILQYHAATTDWKIISNVIYPGTLNLTSDVTGILPVANGGTGVSSSTGTGSVVLSNSPTLVTPALGTPSAAVLTNATGLPVSTGISGLGSNVATFLATPSSANLAAALTDETGSGAAVFANSPTLVTPALGTPSAAVLTNATGLPLTTGTTGVLPETKGGTNQSTYTTGDLLYASASNTLSKLAIGTSGQVLGVSGGAPAWTDSGSGGSGEINAILNPSAASATTGWSDDANHSKTRLTSGSPLDPVTTTAFRFTKDNTNVSTETSTSGVYYPFTLPVGIESKKLKVEFYCIVPATGVWKVSVYDGTTRLALSTDSSGATTLPAGFTGKFTTYFDATANNSYTISFTETSGVAVNLDATGIIVGPGIQPQGAVVGEWQSYTPTFTGFGTVSTQVFQYRRVGSSMEIRGGFASGVPTATEARVSLPSGFTIASVVGGAVQPVGSYFQNKGLATQKGGAVFIEASVTYLTFGEYGTFGTTAVNALAKQNGDKVIENGDSVRFTAVAIPIAEWSGSGTVNLAQNDVEYASTSGTWTSDSSATQYGPSGQIMSGALTVAVTKTVTWQTPVQPTDKIEIQLSLDGTTWFNAESRAPIHLAAAGAIDSSAGVRINGSSGTTTSIQFARYQLMANDDNPVVDWVNTMYWRVVKSKSGQAVGFGMATTTGQAGLVNPYVEGSGVVYSGTYTPTISSPSNVAITTKLMMFTRIGKVVTVSGHVDADVTAAGAAEFFMTLPIASNLALSTDLEGVASHGQAGTPYAAGRCIADTTNDKCQVAWYAGGDLANRELSVMFTYIIK
jgi:hypothetical protein